MARTFGNDQDEALYSALEACAIGTDNNDGREIYRFLGETPLVVLIVKLRTQLNKLGYQIIEDGGENTNGQIYRP